MGMKLELSTKQALELQRLLKEALGDLSHEIAATDNYSFRAGLVERRKLLDSVREELAKLAPPPAGSDEMIREMSQSGD